MLPYIIIMLKAYTYRQIHTIDPDTITRIERERCFAQSIGYQNVLDAKFTIYYLLLLL